MHQVLFDAGSRRILDEKYVRSDLLRAVFLSHAHLDHTLYLGKLIRRLKREGRETPLLVYCHENAWKSLRWWIRLFCFRVPKFVKYMSMGLKMGDPHLKTHRKECQTDLSQSKVLKPIKLGENLLLSIKVAPALHSSGSVVYRIKVSAVATEDSTDSQSVDFAFSPDTSYSSDHLIPFVKNVDYWLLDSAFAKEIIDERYKKFQNHERGGEIVCHSGPYYSGRLCELASVKNYVMIHYVWNRYAANYEDVDNAMIQRARETYGGNIIVSKDLKSIEMRRTD